MVVITDDDKERVLVNYYMYLRKKGKIDKEGAEGLAGLILQLFGYNPKTGEKADIRADMNSDVGKIYYGQKNNSHLRIMPGDFKNRKYYEEIGIALYKYAKDPGKIKAQFGKGKSTKHYAKNINDAEVNVKFFPYVYFIIPRDKKGLSRILDGVNGKIRRSDIGENLAYTIETYDRLNVDERIGYVKWGINYF